MIDHDIPDRYTPTPTPASIEEGKVLARQTLVARPQAYRAWKWLGHWCCTGTAPTQAAARLYQHDVVLPRSQEPGDEHRPRHSVRASVAGRDEAADIAWL